MTEPRKFTKEMADFYASICFEDIPGNDIDTAKRLLLDYVGYAARSVGEEPAKIMRETVAEVGGQPEATIIGASFKSSCPWAAFVNGAMGHMTELDDTHRGTMSHPGDSILPSAIAVGERSKADGKTVLAAIVAGYDCALRAGYSVMPTHYTKGWHPTGTFNVFGSAVTAAKILDLPSDKLNNALGLAGAQTSGNFAHMEIRGMTKDFNPGKAAFSGVLGALLAKNGFVASDNIFENAKGFIHLYSDSPKPERLTANLGKPFLIGEVAHKAFPGCFHLHSSRQAVLEIAEEQSLTHDNVQKVVANIFSIGAWYVDDPDPWAAGKGHYGPRFSAQFQIALALCEGRDGLWSSYDDDYVMTKLNDPEIRKVMERIEVIRDKDLDETFPDAWPSVVHVKTMAGETYSRRVDLPKGEPEDPMSPAELERKFEILGSTQYSSGRLEEIKKAVADFENLTDVSEFTKLLQ